MTDNLHAGQGAYKAWKVLEGIELGQLAYTWHRSGSRIRKNYVRPCGMGCQIGKHYLFSNIKNSFSNIKNLFSAIETNHFLILENI